MTMRLVKCCKTLQPHFYQMLFLFILSRSNISLAETAAVLKQSELEFHLYSLTSQTDNE